MKRVSDNEILVQVLEDGKLPSKANYNDAGFDVYATEDIILWPGQVKKSPLNIRLDLPPGAWARIETKSGLGSKGMMVWAGVIDEGYRGIPHVIMSNIKLKSEEQDDLTGEPYENTEPLMIKKGDKIAQITMNPHHNNFRMIQVDEVSLDTNRGTGGFGSSGR
jgi:dUTP pyrophosphatase